MTSIILFGLIGMCLVFAYVIVFTKPDVKGDKAFDLFGVSPREYRLLGTELGGSKKAYFLSYLGLTGTPDVTFVSIADEDNYIVGEYVDRNHKRAVKYSEYYRIIGYMGCIKKNSLSVEVRGLIAYPDGVVSVKYNQEVFEALVSIASEREEALRPSLQEKNIFPLHRRGYFPPPVVAGARLTS